MRDNGYSDDKYIFCERINKIIPVRENCDKSVYEASKNVLCEDNENSEDFEDWVKRVAAQIEAENKTINK